MGTKISLGWSAFECLRYLNIIALLIKNHRILYLLLGYNILVVPQLLLESA